MKYTQLLISVVPSSPAPSWLSLKSTQWNFWCQLYKFLKTPGSLIQISPNFHKMYRNDCWLTCWNQNCDIPICFRMPACQMNDDRQIAAESRHIFIFCSLKLWSYFTDLHQNFTRCRGISVVINSHIYKTMLHFVSVIFDVCKKAPKLIGYHSNVTSSTAKII